MILDIDPDSAFFSEILSTFGASFLKVWIWYSYSGRNLFVSLNSLLSLNLSDLYYEYLLLSNMTFDYDFDDLSSLLF